MGNYSVVSTGKISISKHSNKITSVIIAIFFTLILLLVILSGLIYFPNRLPCAAEWEELGLTKDGLYEHEVRGVTTRTVNACILGGLTITSEGVEIKIGSRKKFFRLEIFEALLEGKKAMLVYVFRRKKVVELNVKAKKVKH